MSFFNGLFKKLRFNDKNSNDKDSGNQAKLYEEQVIVATPYVPPIRKTVIPEEKKLPAKQYSKKIRRDAAQEIKKAIEVFFHGTQNFKKTGSKSNLDDYQKLLESRVNKHMFKLEDFDQQALMHYINHIKQVRKPTEISPDMQKKIFEESNQILSKYK